MFTRRAKPIRITSNRISGVLLYFVINVFFDKFNGFRVKLNSTVQMCRYFRNHQISNQQSYGMLRSVNWWLVTDVSGRTFGPTFKVKKSKSCPETSETNYQSRLCNIPEDRRARLHRGGSPNSRNQQCPSEHIHSHNVQKKKKKKKGILDCC